MYRRLLGVVLFLTACVCGGRVSAQSLDIRGAAAARSTNPKDIALFASQLPRDRTAVINAQGVITGYLSARAGNLALGPQGNLYNVPFSYTRHVVVYHAPYKNPAFAYNFGEFTTASVAVDQRTGVYAVTSIDYLYGGSGSQVSFFTRDDRLCLTIPQPPQGFFIGGSAFDREGRLVVLLDGSTSSLVGEISGGCKATGIDISTLPSSLYPNSFVAIDKQNNIVLQSGEDVLTFAHPVKHQFSSPLATTVLPQFAAISCLTADGQYLWAAVPQGNGFHAKFLDKYKYPGGNVPVARIPIIGAYSCVTNPPLIP